MLFGVALESSQSGLFPKISSVSVGGAAFRPQVPVVGFGGKTKVQVSLTATPFYDGAILGHA
jgi:hypothetical protein